MTFLTHPNKVDNTQEYSIAYDQLLSNSEEILKYFPTYQGKLLPNKTYLLNVLNTLEPGLIAKTVKEL